MSDNNWKNEINLRRLFERISLIEGDVNISVAPFVATSTTIEETVCDVTHNELIMNSERVIEDLHNASEDRFAMAVHKLYPGLFDAICRGGDLVVLLSTSIEDGWQYIIPLRIRPRTGITNHELEATDCDIALGKFDFVC